MDVSKPATAIDSVVTTPRACVKCGYNIRGLFAGSACPECGTAVAESLRGDLLQHAGVDYIRTILKGHSWVLNSLLAVFLIPLAGFPCLLVIAEIVDAMFSVRISFNVLASCLPLASTLCFMSSLFGYVSLTAPDPQFNGLDRPDASRKIVRACAIILLVVVGLAAAVEFLPLPIGKRAWGLTTSVLSLVGVITASVQFLAMMNYETWLARRIPDAWIVRQAAMHRWVLPLLTLGGFFGEEIVGAFTQPHLITSEIPKYLMLLPFLAIIAYWNLLNRTRKHLKSLVVTGVPAALKGCAP